MTQKELLEIINNAKKNDVKEIDLSRKNLTIIPPEIMKLKNLLVLDLSQNNLSNIPVEIGQLENLSILYLNNNQLSNISPGIGLLEKLSELYLDHNNLKHLPSEVGQLKNLSILDLSHNKLINIPADIGQLENLTRLHLNNNQLSNLKPEIGFLSKLSELIISQNNLIQIPLEIANLKNLSVLDLRENRLNNLPKGISELKRLSSFDLRQNNLSIPPEILNDVWEPEKIITYYNQNQEVSSRPLNEAKVLLVGEAKVGKTSLVKRLISDSFDPHEKMTEGINIHRWPIATKKITVQLNVWDFGGQEIMHATHQFFLTKRSLYLLVLDVRQDENGNRVEYWLKIIRSFGGNSPIIVVGNQVDQKSLDIDRRRLIRKYPNIVGFVETSCKDLKHRGIDQLRREIISQIISLPHVFDVLPIPWFDVKAQLENFDVDFIEYYRYKEICIENGITDSDSQKRLISFLHDLGIALNYSDDPRLNQDSILNPEWVTNGVYSILNNNELITRHKGILERSKLYQILDTVRYPAEKHLFIIDMMQKFELCFPLEGFENIKYLIPDLLSQEEPETGNWEHSLPFQYHYNILPSSIISRFIVRMNQLISKRTYWRNGVVLVKRGTKALVQADKEDRVIFIFVSGNQETRRLLLESIRDQFDYIHSSIPGIEVEEKVPLPDNPKILVDYKNLLDMELLGIQEFVPSGIKKMVRVKDLLEGIETPQSREQRIETRKDLIRNFDRPKRSIQSSNYSQQNRKNTGKFFLLIVVIMTIIFSIVGHILPFYTLLIIILGTLFTMGIVGVFVLVINKDISQENFVLLFIELYKRLPLLNQHKNKIHRKNKY